MLLRLLDLVRLLDDMLLIGFVFSTLLRGGRVDLELSGLVEGNNGRMVMIWGLWVD